MRNLLIQRSAYCFLVAVIVAFSASCADDPASRMENARVHQSNAEYRAAIIELKNVLQADPANIEARAMLGEVTLLNGDSTTAIKELRRAEELGASADQYAVPLARALLLAGSNEEVISLDADAVNDNERRAALSALIGMAQLNLENQPEAERQFAAAVALVPGQPDALLGQAKIAGKRGDIAAARSGLEEILQSNPDDTEALETLARLQQSAGEYAAAEDNYNKGLKVIEGTNRAQERMEFLSGLTDTLLSQDRASEAQSSAARMLAIMSDHPMALWQAARSDFAAGDFDAAIDKAGRLITISPKSAPPRLLMAGAAVAKGDSALAATHLEEVVNNDPGNQAARKLLASVRLEQGDSAQALELLEPLMAAGTDDAELLAMAGAANIKSGNQEVGLELMERGMEIGSSDPSLVLKAAANFLASGELDRAIEVLESLPEEERVGQREMLLILAQLRKGDEDAARAMAESVVNDRPESHEAHSLLGGFHLAVGELDQARSEFQKALELNPTNLGPVVNLARIDIAQKKPEQARARFQAILDANPGNLLALTALAELAEVGGNVAQGAELLEQAREANPDAVDPPLRLCRYYLRTGNLQLAEERANQAIRIAPSNSDGHMMLGQTLLADERHTEALGHLETAIELAPTSARAHYHYARALEAVGQIDRGFDAYKKAARLNKQFYPARVGLAMAAAARGDLDLATSTADSLIADFPGRVEPLVVKGRIQASAEDFAGALQSFQQANEISPSTEIALNLYQLQKSMGVAEPWAQIKQWVADHPEDMKARSALGAAYFESGMGDEARESFKQVMATAPDAKVALTLAELDRADGNVDAAVDWLQKAVALDPKGLPARQSLANLELRRGETDAAAKLLRDLRKDYPNEPELNLLEGEVYLALGNYTDSIAAFDRALKEKPTEFLTLRRYDAGKQSGEDDAWRALAKWFDDHPGHISAGLQLAQDYSERDWHDQAVETYEKVLAADPGNVLALNNIAWAYLARGKNDDLKRGLDAAAKAYNKMPELAAIGDTYGWLLVKDGQNQRAVEILAAAAEGDDVEPEIVYHYAAALEAVGNDAEAIALLNRLLADEKSFDSREDAEILQRRLSP